MSRVCTQQCTSYDLHDVRRAVSGALRSLPSARDALREADSVLLKPNLLSSSAVPGDAVNTHPAVVRALAEIAVSDYQCRASIGDSCGSLSPSSTADAIQNSRMDTVARAVGAELYNVDTQSRREVDFDGRVLARADMPSTLDEFDTVVSVPKLKTHHLTYLTLAVKNLLGLLPGAWKKRAHLMAPTGTEMAELLCDVYEYVRPDVCLVDGVVGMEGNGPNNGSPRRLNYIGASADGVALDSVSARIMDMEPAEVPLLQACRRRSLGETEMDRIEVAGDGLEPFRRRDFAKPPAYRNALVLRLLPRSVFHFVFEQMSTVYASVDQEACRRCGECARNCPSGAIEWDSGANRYHVERDRCISCYCCDEVCPYDAIRMVGTPLRRALERTVSAGRFLLGCTGS
ncbi:MAG: DUF362 domain-containing protein [Planctomycetota bacterium]